MSKLLGGWPRGGVNDDHDALQARAREGTAFVREQGMRAVVVTILGCVIDLPAKRLRTRETVDLPPVLLRGDEAARRDGSGRQGAGKRKGEGAARPVNLDAKGSLSSPVGGLSLAQAKPLPGSPCAG